MFASRNSPVYKTYKTMRNLCHFQFLLSVVAILFFVEKAAAQEPAATTKDGVQVFLEESLIDLPQEKQKIIRNNPDDFTIVSSKSELEELLREKGVEADDPSNSVSNEGSSKDQRGADFQQERDKLTQMLDAGKISKEQYEKRMAELSQVSNGSAKNQEKNASEEDVISTVEQRLQQADSYDELKREKRKLLEQYEVGNISQDEAKALIQKYEQAISEKQKKGSNNVSPSEQAASGNNSKSASQSNGDVTKENSDALMSELEKERRRLVGLYEEGEISKDELDDRYIEKKADLEEKYNINQQKDDRLNSDKSSKQSEGKPDQFKSMDERGGDLSEDGSKSDTSYEREKEKLEQQGYSDDEIHEILKKKYPSR